MKVSVKELKKAAAKRTRAGPSERQTGPTPKRLTVSRPTPPIPSKPTAAPEVDLTADTPPEGEAIERRSPSPIVGGSPAEEGPAPREASPAQARHWDEGPSGAADSPPEQALSGSPPHAGSVTAGIAEGSGAEATLPRASIRSDVRWAEKLIASILRPEIQDELNQLSAANFFRESYAAVIKASIVQVAHSLAATRDVIHEGKGVIRKAQEEAEEALKGAEEARKEAEEARARAEAAEKALGSVKSQAGMEADRARAALTQLTEMENAVMARNLHIAELTATSQSAELRIREVEERIKEVEGRAVELEERAMAAEAKAEEMSRSLEVERAAAAPLAAERARVAELEAEMEAKISKAIEEYRASKSFREEVVEASADAYLQGFQQGKEKVARDLNFPQALEVEPEHLSEMSSSGDESGPARP